VYRGVVSRRRKLGLRCVCVLELVYGGRGREQGTGQAHTCGSSRRRSSTASRSRSSKSTRLARRFSRWEGPQHSLLPGPCPCGGSRISRVPLRPQRALPGPALPSPPHTPVPSSTLSNTHAHRGLRLSACQVAQQRRSSASAQALRLLLLQQVALAVCPSPLAPGSPPLPPTQTPPRPPQPLLPSPAPPPASLLVTGGAAPSAPSTVTVTVTGRQEVGGLCHLHDAIQRRGHPQGPARPAPALSTCPSLGPHLTFPPPCPWSPWLLALLSRRPFRTSPLEAGPETCVLVRLGLGWGFVREVMVRRSGSEAVRGDLRGGPVPRHRGPAVLPLPPHQRRSRRSHCSCCCARLLCTPQTPGSSPGPSWLPLHPGLSPFRIAHAQGASSRKSKPRPAHAPHRA